MVIPIIVRFAYGVCMLTLNRVIEITIAGEKWSQLAWKPVQVSLKLSTNAINAGKLEK